MDFVSSEEFDVARAAEERELVAQLGPLEMPSKHPAAENAVVILLDAMLERPADAALQYQAILSLLRMSATDGEKDIVTQSGCIQTAVDAMRKFPNNRKLVCKGAVLLGNLAYSAEDAKHQIDRCGGIFLLLDLIAYLEDDEEFLLWACVAIRNISHDSTRYQARLASMGTVELLQRVLKRFDRNKDIQSQGIAVLGNIGLAGLEAQRIIRECQGIEIVLNALRQFLPCMSLTRHCVQASKNICITNTKNQQLFEDLGGVELFTELLRKDPAETSLVLEVCEALRFMSFEKVVRVAIGKSGALIAMIDAMDTVCKDGSEGPTCVLKALSNATFSPDENKQIFLRCGGVQAVLKVLERYRDDTFVTEAGLRVFRNVADRGGASCRLLGDAGVFLFAIARAEYFSSHSTITEHVFAMIVNVLHAPYDHVLMGRSPRLLGELVKRQVDELPYSIEVQKLGRTLQASLQKSENEPILQPDIGSKKNSFLRLFRRSTS